LPLKNTALNIHRSLSAATKLTASIRGNVGQLASFKYGVIFENVHFFLTIFYSFFGGLFLIFIGFLHKRLVSLYVNLSAASLGRGALSISYH